MGMILKPSIKIGKGFYNDLGGQVVVNEAKFHIDWNRETGKILVRDEKGGECGAGELKENGRKKSDRSPDYVGFIRIELDEYEIIAYNQQSVSISVFKDGE